MSSKTNNVERTYTKVGQKYTNTTAKKDALAASISTIKWYDVDESTTLPMSQGYAINEIISQFNLKADRVGIGMHKDGAAILAVRALYNRGEVKRATLYVIDEGGSSVVPVATDIEKETVEA